MRGNDEQQLDVSATLARSGEYPTITPCALFVS